MFLRREAFEKTKKMIEKHNEEFANGIHSYDLKITEFADWVRKLLFHPQATVKC